MAAKDSGGSVQDERTQRDARNLSTAVQLANALQNRKDWEARLLEAVESLLDFPHDSSPSPREALYFGSSVQNFTPSDLGDVTEERRIDGKCGYPLCPKVPKALRTGHGAPRVSSRDRDFCSAACARKMAFVKAQLSAVPAWERMPGQQHAILLPDGDQALLESAMPIQHKKPQQKRPMATADNLAELALERGEKATSLRPQEVMTDVIIEKQTTQGPQPFAWNGHGTSSSGGGIEGYHPKLVHNTIPKAAQSSKFTNELDGDGDDEGIGDTGHDLDDLAKDVLRQMGRGMES